MKTKMYLVIEGVSDGEDPIYHGVFSSEEKAKALALKLSKEYWSSVLQNNQGVLSYPYADKEESWYDDNNFLVEEVEADFN